MKETWKTIKDYPKYKVSNLGRVHSSKRGGRLLSLRRNSRGYSHVALYRNGEAHFFSVHKLVLGNFIGKRSRDKQCNHKNGIKTDNRLKNLEWVTSSENGKHAYRMGLNTPQNGEQNGQAKLTEKDILKIRGLHLGGLGFKKIATEFKTSRTNISRIIHRRRWKHVGIKQGE